LDFAGPVSFPGLLATFLACLAGFAAGLDTCLGLDLLAIIRSTQITTTGQHIMNAPCKVKQTGD